MNLEEERDALKRDLRGLNEMLFLVLYEVGEPVIVPKEHMRIPANHQVTVYDNQEDNCFVFSVVDLGEDSGLVAEDG